jgi:hypothetical protein
MEWQPDGAQVSHAVSQFSARTSACPEGALMLTIGAAQRTAQYESGPTVNSMDALAGETPPPVPPVFPPLPPDPVEPPLLTLHSWL